jgi:LDH2 family malate/lactate/ureidoglycolate dehydrogenase
MQTSDNILMDVVQQAEPRKGRKKIALPSDWQRQKEKRLK